MILMNPFTRQTLNTKGVPNPRGCNQHTGPNCGGPRTWFDIGHGVLDSDQVDAYIVSGGRLVEKPIVPEGDLRPPNHFDLFDQKSLDSATAKGRVDHLKKQISVTGRRVDFVKKLLGRKYPDYDIYDFEGGLT